MADDLQLNDIQMKFCEEYLIDLNGTRAAMRAGYTENPNSAAVEASRLLRNVNVRACIRSLMDERSKETFVDACHVVEGLKEVFDRCMQAAPVMVFDPIEKQMVQAKDEEGQGIWQFDSTGANRAAELLGKHVGIFEKDNKQKAPPPITAQDLSSLIKDIEE